MYYYQSIETKILLLEFCQPVIRFIRSNKVNHPQHFIILALLKTYRLSVGIYQETELDEKEMYSITNKFCKSRDLKSVWSMLEELLKSLNVG